MTGGRMPIAPNIAWPVHNRGTRGNQMHFYQMHTKQRNKETKKKKRKEHRSLGFFNTTKKEQKGNYQGGRRGLVRNANRFQKYVNKNTKGGRIFNQSSPR